MHVAFKAEMQWCAVKLSDGFGAVGGNRPKLLKKKKILVVDRNQQRKLRLVSPVFVAQTGSVGMLVRSRLGVQDLAEA